MYKFMSKTMCPWSIDEVMIFLSFNEFTLNDTSPIFEHNTMDLFCFN